MKIKLLAARADTGRTSQAFFVNEYTDIRMVWYNQDPPTILEHGNLIELQGEGQLMLQVRVGEEWINVG